MPQVHGTLLRKGSTQIFSRHCYQRPSVFSSEQPLSYLGDYLQQLRAEAKLVVDRLYLYQAES
jgi:hypothetical protein